MQLSNQLGKLPPQATDLEDALIGCLMLWKQVRDNISFLKPEHFYRDSNQIIYRCIQEVEVCSLESVGKKLKEKGLIEQVGGYYHLSQLTGMALNPAQDEWAARIIIQCFVRRELIRISSDVMQQAYDDTMDCLNLFDHFVAETEMVESIFSPETTQFNVVSRPENEQEVMDAARLNQIKMGLSTGFEEFDMYFRFKPSSFVILNGTDNSGKTTFVLFMAVVSNRLHGWKWILACMENQEGHVRLETIQLATGKPVSRLTEQEYQQWYQWSLDNFTILIIKDQITGERLMRIAQKIITGKHHHAFLIDPYNALDLDLKSPNQSSHEYHYRLTGLMRNFIKRNNCSIWLNTHAVTEALRRLHKQGPYEGFPMPPEKADVEGGGKFANRADDFLTIHRYNQHPDEFNITQVHVRKIKVTQTGGRPTPKDSPVKLMIPKGLFTFTDVNGNGPIVKTGISAPFHSLVPPKINDQNDDDDPPF